MKDQKSKDAIYLIDRMLEEFPGLVDFDSDVDGAELVDFITQQIDEMDSLKGTKWKSSRRNQY